MDIRYPWEIYQAHIEPGTTDLISIEQGEGPFKSSMHVHREDIPHLLQAIAQAAGLHVEIATAGAVMASGDEVAITRLHAMHEEDEVDVSPYCKREQHYDACPDDEYPNCMCECHVEDYR